MRVLTMDSLSRDWRLRAGAVVVAGALLAVSCAGAEAASSGASTVLTIAPNPQSSITKNFNPYISTSGLSDASGASVDSLIYEPLLQFNPVEDTVTPWLASKYTWSKGGKALTFTIRRGVKWSDGTKFSASDVAFTYGLMKKDPAVNLNAIQIAGIKQGSRSVTLTFAAPQYQNLDNIASVPIVNKAQWSKVGNPATYVDADPVGTGPFLVNTFTSTDITLKKNPDYWQAGKPKIDEVNVAIYNSDATIQEALEKDQVDWATDFISGVKKLYVDTSQYHGFWAPAIYSIALVPNLKTFPTNSLAVRKAISLAADRNAFSAEAENGQYPPFHSATGILDVQKIFVPSSLAGDTLETNDAKARQILKAAGYVMGSDGYFATKSGKELSLQITDPSSFTDWDESASILTQNLKAVGIKATFVGQSVGGFVSNLEHGDFQLAQWFGTSSPSITPYGVYNNWLNSKLTAPIGKAASSNYERLVNPTVDAELKKVSESDGVAATRRALAPLEKFVATQLPVIPTIQEGAIDEYNDQNFVGWPSASDPYTSGAAAAITNEVVLLHLRPRK